MLQKNGEFFMVKQIPFYETNPRKTCITAKRIHHKKLVGGFNPFEKYQSNWESSPNRGENKKMKPPPSHVHKAIDCFFGSASRWYV